MMNASEGTVLEVNAAARAAAEVSQSIQFIASATEETTATMREVAAHAIDASGLGQSGVEQITVAGSEEDDGLPYYANSIGMRFYRDQRACTQLGLAARAETNCVMNLAAAMEDFENPIN